MWQEHQHSYKDVWIWWSNPEDKEHARQNVRKFGKCWCKKPHRGKKCTIETGPRWPPEKIAKNYYYATNSTTGVEEEKSEKLVSWTDKRDNKCTNNALKSYLRKQLDRWKNIHSRTLSKQIDVKNYKQNDTWKDEIYKKIYYRKAGPEPIEFTVHLLLFSHIS